MEVQSFTGGPNPTEDKFTKQVKRYTAAIPSSAYLAVAVCCGYGSISAVSSRRSGEMGQFYRAVGSYVAHYRALQQNG